MSFTLITTKMPSVGKVTVAWDRMMPAGLHVTAEGPVTQLGWQNERLVPWVYASEPKDGIWDMDLVADAPQIFLGLYSPRVLTAVLLIRPAPRWVKGVRVHSSSNTSQAGEDENTELARAVSRIAVATAGQGGGPFPLRDPGDPFPWVMQI